MTAAANTPPRKTLVFICSSADEAVALIHQHAPGNYWAQIIHVADGKIELHLRPLEEKEY
jgi:hypothetical protein